MSITIVPPNPLPFLKKEADSILAVIDELEQAIEKQVHQLNGLKAVHVAVSNELDRLRAHAVDKPDQLEFDLDD